MPNHSRQLHINVNFQAAGSHPGAWRSAEGRRFAALDIAHFQEVARIAERGPARRGVSREQPGHPGETRGRAAFRARPIVPWPRWRW